MWLRFPSFQRVRTRRKIADPPLGRRVPAHQLFDIGKLEAFVPEAWRHRRAGQRPGTVAAAALPDAPGHDDLRHVPRCVVAAEHGLLDAAVREQQQQAPRRAGVEVIDLGALQAVQRRVVFAADQREDRRPEPVLQVLLNQRALAPFPRPQAARDAGRKPTAAPEAPGEARCVREAAP